MRIPARVLHLIWALDLGGAERQVIDIVRRLDRRRFEPVVGCLVRKGRWGEQLEQQGIEVHEFGKRGAFDLGLLPRLVRFLRAGRFSILHTHAFTAATWGRAAAAIARVPVVIAHEHSAFSLPHLRYRLVDRLLAPFTDRWVAVSEALARDLVAGEGLPPSRLLVIRNGIAFPGPGEEARLEGEGARQRRSLAGPDFDQLVGTVGRLEPRKGLEVLLEALAILAPEWPRLGLVLIGEGPSRDAIAARCRELGLEARVRFTGRREDIPELLRALDVFVLSSHTEGLSISLVEAAAAARPIVATAVGGNGEVIENGRTGLLVPPRDPVALAGGIRRLLASGDAAGAMGQRAAAFVRLNFSSERMVQQIEDLYASLLPEA